MERIRALLAEAEHRARDQDWGAALRALLDAWRHRRSTLLAEAVTAAGHRAAGRRKPIQSELAGRTLAEAWKTIVLEYDPADLSRLLASLDADLDDDTDPRAILRRLEWLEHADPDPRLAMALARIVEEMPWKTRGSRDLYKIAFRMLETIRDSRVTEVLQRALFIDRSDVEFGQWYQRRVRSIADTLRKQPTEEVPQAEAERIHTLMGVLSGVRSGAQRIAELYEAVYDDPHDDGLRLVLADALHEVGDPRGDLITLQMAEHMGQSTRRTRRRVRKLLERHSDEWLGELRDLVDRDSVQFRRGFLASCSIPRWANENHLRDSLSSRIWSTVESVDGPSFLLTHPALRALRHIAPTRWQLRDLLGELRGDLPFVELHAHIVEPHETPLLLRLLDRMPKIERLTFRDGSQGSWHDILQHEYVRERVNHFALPAHLTIDEIVDVGPVVARDTQVRDFVAHTPGWIWHWSRQPDGNALDTLTIVFELAVRPADAEEIEWLVANLRAIPPQTIRVLHLQAPPEQRVPGALRRALAHAIDALDPAERWISASFMP